MNSESAPATAPCTTPRPIRVLCVEDNQLVADAIERKLAGDPEFESLGWVDTAERLAESLTRKPAHVVCMDLDIPGQDTFEMIRMVRDKHPESRVLVLTGRIGGEHVNKAIDAGAWGYLSKAEESRVIVDSIRRVASGAFVLGRYAQAEYRGAAAPPPPGQPTAATEHAARTGWGPFKFFRRSKTKGTA